MTENQTLLPLFYRLRKAGFKHLYVDDYQRLLKAWRDGFGWESQESLAEICKLLWVKSFEQERIFDEYFAQFISNISGGKSSQGVKSRQTVTAATKSEQLIGNNPPSKPKPTENQPEPETDALQSVQAVIAVQIDRKFAQGYEKQSRKQLRVETNYLPPSIQKIKEGWQNLHCNLQKGNLTEVDLVQTIANIEQQGKFFDLAMVPSQQKRLEVILLLDQYGSMVPFQLFSRQLRETASLGGQVSRINTYYFHNFPQNELYCDSEFQHPETTSQVLLNLQPERTIILIFSDAGASRRGFNASRVSATQEFISKLKPRCRALVWLNPVPQNYWSKTTAIKIAKFVNMFEFSKQGWQKAITCLQASGGKS